MVSSAEAPSYGGGALSAVALAARRSLWRLKATYFLLYGGLACAWPWLPLLLERRYGLGAGAVARLCAARPLVGALCSPLWGAAADRTKRHGVAHALSILSGAAVRLSMVFLPPAAGGEDAGDTSGVIELRLMVLLVASEALGAGASSLADGAANAALVRAGLPLGDFGKLRLWGAVGWGWVFAPLSGAFIERLPSSARWAASFGMHTALLAATAGVCATLDHSTRRPLKRSKSDPPGGDIELHAADRRSALSKLMDVASRPYIALTYVTFYICSLFMGCVETYLFLYLDTLGGGELVMGVALTFTCLSEVAVFFFAQRVMSALGVPRSVALVLLCFSLRFSFYWLLPLVGTTWAVLPVQLLHGITFGLFYSLGQKFTHEASPPGLHATCQGLFSGIVSAGMFSGALAGGALFGWSPRRMWLTLAALALVAAPLYYCLALRLLGDDADGAKSAISSKTAEVVAEDEEAEGLLSSMSDSGDESDLLTSRNNPL